MLYCHFAGDAPWPRSVMRLLWERHPKVQEAFRRARIFVIEFEVGVNELDGADCIPMEIAEQSAREAYYACPLREAGPLLFIAHTSGGNFRDLGASALPLPAGTFLGACGYVEGGVHFYGVDGTFIESEDWSRASEYALRLAEGYEPDALPPARQATKPR